MKCIGANIFGKVGEGVHSIRLFNIAIVDVILTIIGAYVITRIFNISFLTTLLGLFIAGIILHRLFCVRTTVDKLLFD